MIDILFINPPDEFLEKKDRSPAGLAMLSSVLEKAGYSVKIIDIFVQKINKDELKKVIKTYQPKIIGIGGTTDNRFNSFELAKLIKQINENIVVIYG